MVNRSRNNAKTRRRNRRGGETIITTGTNPSSQIEVDIDQNIPPETTVVIDNQNQNQNIPPETKVVIDNQNGSWTSGITSGFNTLTDGAKNLVGENEGEKGTLSSMTDSVTGLFSSEPTVKPEAVAPKEQSYYEKFKFWGGKRGSRRRQQKGGRGLGLTYYATPVNGLRVAEPTYMEYYKGGKRRSGKRSAKRSAKRRTRRCKSKRCKKTCKKQHRHKRK